MNPAQYTWLYNSTEFVNKSVMANSGGLYSRLFRDVGAALMAYVFTYVGCSALYFLARDTWPALWHMWLGPVFYYLGYAPEPNDDGKPPGTDCGTDYYACVAGGDLAFGGVFASEIAEACHALFC